MMFHMFSFFSLGTHLQSLGIRGHKSDVLTREEQKRGNFSLPNPITWPTSFIFMTTRTPPRNAQISPGPVTLLFWRSPFSSVDQKEFKLKKIIMHKILVKQLCKLVDKLHTNTHDFPLFIIRWLGHQGGVRWLPIKALCYRGRMCIKPTDGCGRNLCLPIRVLGLVIRAYWLGLHARYGDWWIDYTSILAGCHLNL